MKVKIDQHIGSLVEAWTRRRFYVGSALLILGVGATGSTWRPALFAYALLLPLVALGVRDALQTRHTLLRNFPLLGRLRYLLESLRPEIRQYFVESDTEETPFSREKRSLVFARAKGQLDTRPFGTLRNVNAVGYEWLSHSLAPVKAALGADRVTVGGTRCVKPYDCSVLNVSAMSYGSLSKNAILALNEGAKLGKFAHNTGEGGISPYHEQPGGDLIWQIGTGYFGCRTKDGFFDPDLFAQAASRDQVKMIEVKLSQGAKPAHGGILPASKVTEEIAKIRLVPVGREVDSPPAHSAFAGPRGLLEYVERLRQLSGGKPVGFKLCIGKPSEWFCIVRAMLETGLLPDFITVDGAEGGTGAAPLEFSNSVGVPLNDGLCLVHGSLVGAGLREQIKLFAAGKIASGFQIFQKMALGADACNSARAMMFALGCIQALRCNTNDCPTGVATTNPELMYGLVVEQKSRRVANYHKETVESFLELLGAAGLSDASEVGPRHIMRRTASGTICTLDQVYPQFAPGGLQHDSVPEIYRPAWLCSRADAFVAG